MKHYIVYETGTGRIVKTGLCPDDVFNQQVQEGQSILEGIANDLTQFIVNSVVVNKEPNPAIADKVDMLANGIDLVTISDLPSPTTILIDSNKYMVTDGTFSFTIDTPGEYIVRCDAFPYLLKEFTVNAS